MTSSLITSQNLLEWDDNKGYGFLDAPKFDYDSNYFKKYQLLDQTETGHELTAFRIRFVERFTNKKPVDVGIGGGLFCREMDCLGYDVNSDAVKWLIDNNRYHDPYIKKCDVMTFWDSIEHILVIDEILKMCSRWVFVSIPIFKDKEDCLNSVHYKPGEHIHYFTHFGFIAMMAHQGFILRDYTNQETIIGRDSITSYAFERK